MVSRPFPQHVSYYPGCIKPNHISQQKMDGQVLHFYQSWKKQYIHASPGVDQAYVFFKEEGSNLQSVSEGQGYGMLITALMAGADPVAQGTFDSLYRYVLAHPSKPDSPLMAWSQFYNNRNKDQTSATDGDMDIAYALLLAHEQWGSAGKYNYLADARYMIHSIMKYEINQNSYSILLSDAVEFDSGDYFDMRSSDFMPLHCKMFELATADPQWNKVVDNNYKLFQHLQEGYSPDAGLIPDFIIHINKTARPAHPGYLESRYDGCYNYNACRVPLRIATDYLLTGDKRSIEMLNKINYWIRQTTSDNPDNISAGYTLDGKDIGSRNYEALSFIGPLAVAAMVNSKNQKWLNSIWDYLLNFKLNDFDYYDNSLKMLSLLIISGNYWDPSGPSIAFHGQDVKTHS
ncbi:MAG: glycosyl hydrolase family 8 [Bacteroidota bacterium]|nr:glycosyl hydrolase family 8 [Bacteroidota bacterium]MDP4213053.1 glycosyl hydrolase family 8 [Bacteroidota bacterium]MDP4248708.1 glycosyl hydrolase family 8 [Bacteroidota bacterium]